MPVEEIQRLLGSIEAKVSMLLEGRTEDKERMTTVEDRVADLERWKTRVVAWCAGAVTVLTGVIGLLFKLMTELRK